MQILALKPGHDGGAALIQDRQLVWSVEAEKDSNPRHAPISASVLLEASARMEGVPDVVCVSGWGAVGRPGQNRIGAGYLGIAAPVLGPADFFGQGTQQFTSSHERAHVMMALGMAPQSTWELATVLVWEAVVGNLYVVDRSLTIRRRVRVLDQCGTRYAFLFGLADPSRPDNGWPHDGDPGKLMALAAYASPGDADRGIRKTVADLMTIKRLTPRSKNDFRASPLYNVGVESQATKVAAALLGERIFERFAQAAKKMPAGSPLFISGGCGLNCDWNARWARLGHFSSVFVPPCTNDSGAAIGTAIDALAAITGSAEIEWDVYRGLEFTHDVAPAARWRRRPVDYDRLAGALARGEIIAWVQGRWEIGPRALGNRSILAEPFRTETRDRLNTIKLREAYRPIAPVCRREDIAAAFHETFEDPHMLYTRRVRTERNLQAVTHVDGSARAQTVGPEQNPQLHRLLSAFASRTGIGVLCNTSLNFPGHGFINRMSDLQLFCERRGLDGMVVGDTWYRRSPIRKLRLRLRHEAERRGLAYWESG